MAKLTEGDLVFRLVLALLAAVALYGAVTFVSSYSCCRRERFRASACRANLRQLHMAALAYTHDYDGRFPLKPSPRGDWMAAEWSALWMPDFRSYKAIGVRPGPLTGYAKNYGLTGCPSDNSRRRPDFAATPHSSYTWNNALCGKLAKDVPNDLLVWDRAPFHDRGRNVITVSGKPRWLSEKDFAANLQPEGEVQ